MKKRVLAAIVAVVLLFGSSAASISSMIRSRVGLGISGIFAPAHELLDGFVLLAGPNGGPE